MGYPTKVQLISRKKGADQYYINFPTAVAEAMEFQKGEIIEWIGFAVMTWSVAALAFAIWTAANLAPRALSHHKWYRETFPDYPTERKALIPFVV